ncbi:MAG: type IV secretory system conjugative DNA transfer family protein [Clostridia bacterium]|nr:type IV secretory system conjugative DNA transfer family protein [Clostridia bacterium]
MSNEELLLDGYENMKLCRYDEKGGKLISYDELADLSVNGVLKACYHKNGKLYLRFSEQDSHVCVVAATGLGKTTSYVAQQINVFIRQKDKRSLFISDPKGELYHLFAALFKANEYDVRLYNFRNPMNSEYWNPFVPVYRKYQKAFEIYDEVGTVKTEDGIFNTFRGKVYKNQYELDEVLRIQHELMLSDVGDDIDRLTLIMIQTRSTKDPSWEDSAREYARGVLWGMLEDSREENLTSKENDYSMRQLITEELFSLTTLLRIVNCFVDSNAFDDKGFFTSRDENSRAKQYVQSIILENAPVTRHGIISCFTAGISAFKENAMRLIMCANSVDFTTIMDKPTVIFVNYKDEVKAHYQVISMMVQDLYCTLIEKANKSGGKLKVPFCFILDEFGNFPKITDFDTTISACRGRNIFFILIIQSYAQLNNVYGNDVAEIIRDNLNVHVFFGSNNPNTLEEFSRECGSKARFSPLGALNGNSSEIDNFQIEVIPLMPKSELSHFRLGECVITEANSGHILWSKIERYYLCKEFDNLELSDLSDYKGAINPLDKKYIFTREERKFEKRKFDWDF